MVPSAVAHLILCYLSSVHRKTDLETSNVQAVLIGVLLLMAGCATVRSGVREYRGCEAEDARHISEYRYRFRCGSESVFCHEGRDGVHLACAADGQKRKCTRLDNYNTNATLVCE